MRRSTPRIEVRVLRRQHASHHDQHPIVVYSLMPSQVFRAPSDLPIRRMISFSVRVVLMHHRAPSQVEVLRAHLLHPPNNLWDFEVLHHALLHKSVLHLIHSTIMYPIHSRKARDQGLPTIQNFLTREDFRTRRNTPPIRRLFQVCQVHPTFVVIRNSFHHKCH